MGYVGRETGGEDSGAPVTSSGQAMLSGFQPL